MQRWQRSGVAAAAAATIVVAFAESRSAAKQPEQGWQQSLQEQELCSAGADAADHRDGASDTAGTCGATGAAGTNGGADDTIGAGGAGFVCFQ